MTYSAKCQYSNAGRVSRFGYGWERQISLTGLGDIEL
jgi:hypothetical protein